MGPDDQRSGSGGGRSWTQVLVLVFTSCVTTHKLLEFFVPLFLHLLNGDNPGTSLDDQERK